MEEQSRLEELDKRYIWHPFTQMKDWEREKTVIVARGSDSCIEDIEGNRYLDGVSSLWVNIHGHRKKEIDDAIREQVEQISHCTMLGLSNVPAIKLAERLMGVIGRSFGRTGSPSWLPSSGQAQGPVLSRVFYSDNGSTAVEVALKMAFQYWLHKGVTGKNSFLSLNNAYHGDTIGAVSVGGVDIFHEVFGPLLFKTFKAPSPYCYRCELGGEFPGCDIFCLKKMEGILAGHGDEIAAVIIEPVVQAVGGMIVSPPGYLRGVRDLCTRYNVLLIADEVATGFGRTGLMFACEHESVVPDMLCLSKGITGGYLPLAVTVTTGEVYDAFLGDFRDLKTFFHGHSYTGNPLGCAAALACLDIFEKEGTLKRLQSRIKLLERGLREISRLKHVGEARNRGFMAGVELVKDRPTKEPYPWEEKMGWRVSMHARGKGVFIRPLGNVVVIMPPLNISEQDLRRMLDVIGESIKAVT
ncbi:MAG: adenosylmethionine--8-amino-7-oxononanoate transaminase [Candidatus Sulfobium sp.]|jgi:adenosylmethionine-8-amino-7-oxononanoate aminotransferase